MSEVEVYRLRERLTRLVREEPEVIAALVWLLGSADDLADWIRLAGKKGRVTRRVGEGLRLHGGEP